MKTILGKGGRLVIPAQYRRALELSVGDEVILRLEGDELRLLTARAGLRRAQELVRRYAPKGRALAAELIAERRRESRRE